jgi:hypothetical protein
MMLDCASVASCALGCLILSVFSLFRMTSSLYIYLAVRPKQLLEPRGSSENDTMMLLPVGICLLVPVACDICLLLPVDILL